VLGQMRHGPALHVDKIRIASGTHHLQNSMRCSADIDPDVEIVFAVKRDQVGIEAIINRQEISPWGEGLQGVGLAGHEDLSVRGWCLSDLP